MYLHEFAYNRYPESEEIFKELEIVKTASRSFVLHISFQKKKKIIFDSQFVETQIKTMDEECQAIMGFVATLEEEYPPELSSAFCQKMREFEAISRPQINKLKTKHKQAVTLTKKTAEYLQYELEEAKPELLFRVIQNFIDGLTKAKDDLKKLELARKKAEEMKKRERAKKSNNNQAGKKGLTVAERIEAKEEKFEENQKIGNRLFHDIRTKSNNFSQRGETLRKSLQLRKDDVTKFQEIAAQEKKIDEKDEDGNDDNDNDDNEDDEEEDSNIARFAPKLEPVSEAELKTNKNTIAGNSLSPKQSVSSLAYL
ncbi:hypothetical protein RFI_22982 [Reticulomyxa filosa]|uniref:FH2 domain-containing protein n=1 Tax=Reticulomyxa filosa TaxID=46433 RepID=X6MMU3_RETFI|nr:hypothetical protein RFI_22982 [Reticulomyxa filosa]|eukprot:ETO14380.1 hypothetical protein RFI_22982 [Reticulomyxa filosa]